MRSRSVAALAVGLVSCGGSAARPVEPGTAGDDPGGPHIARGPDVEEDDEDDGVELEGTRGHLEQHEIQAGVAKHQAALSACYQDQIRGARFLGGAVELAFVVSPTGEVAEVKLSKGDLGSWAVERCLLDTARAMRFAAPRGKREADFTLPLDFGGGKGVQWWAEERAETEVDKLLIDFEACSGEHGGGPSNLWVTLYVGPRGEVRSVGFASPAAAIDPAWADCASAKATGWVLSDPHGKIAKAGFRYRPE